MATDEFTRCPKCGRIVPAAKDCDCGYGLAWINFNRANLNHALEQGWMRLPCPPSLAFPKGVTVLVHPNENCNHEECPYYPRPHRHRASNVEEVVFEEDKPGGATPA